MPTELSFKSIFGDIEDIDKTSKALEREKRNVRNANRRKKVTTAKKKAASQPKADYKGAAQRSAAKRKAARTKNIDRMQGSGKTPASVKRANAPKASTGAKITKALGPKGVVGKASVPAFVAWANFTAGKGIGDYIGSKRNQKKRDAKTAEAKRMTQASFDANRKKRTGMGSDVPNVRGEGGTSRPSASIKSKPKAAPKASSDSFGSAFKAARKAQGAGGVFEYKGKKYSTNYKGEGKKKSPLAAVGSAKRKAQYDNRGWAYDDTIKRASGGKVMKKHSKGYMAGGSVWHDKQGMGGMPASHSPQYMAGGTVRKMAGMGGKPHSSSPKYAKGGVAHGSTNRMGNMDYGQMVPGGKHGHDDGWS